MKIKHLVLIPVILFILLALTGCIEMTLYEYNYDEHGAALTYNGVTTAQTFTIGTVGDNVDIELSYVRLKLFRVGNPGVFNVKIMNTSKYQEWYLPNTVLDTISYDGNTITNNTSGEWYKFELSATLNKSTKYAIALEGINAIYPYNVLWWRSSYPTDGSYSGGAYCYKYTGTRWFEAHYQDHCFEIYGTKIMEELPVSYAQKPLLKGAQKIIRSIESGDPDNYEYIPNKDMWVCYDNNPETGKIVKHNNPDDPVFIRDDKTHNKEQIFHKYDTRKTIMKNGKFIFNKKTSKI